MGQISSIYNNPMFFKKKKKGKQQLKDHKKAVRASRKKKEGFYTSREWLELRYKALVKHGRRCGCCGRTPEHGAVMHVDHILPRSKHPHLQLRLDNLQVLCEQCNKGKSNIHIDDFRQEGNK